MTLKDKLENLQIPTFFFDALRKRVGIRVPTNAKRGGSLEMSRFFKNLQMERRDPEPPKFRKRR